MVPFASVHRECITPAADSDECGLALWVVVMCGDGKESYRQCEPPASPEEIYAEYKRRKEKKEGYDEFMEYMR